MLQRLACLGVTNAFGVRLLPMGRGGKDLEILVLRHQLMMLGAPASSEKVRSDASDRAFLAVVPHRRPRNVLRQLRLQMRPDTVVR